MSKFPYKNYFELPIVLSGLFAPDSPSENLYTRMPKEIPKVENIVYLGCHIFQTRHIVDNLTDIFDRLGINYAAVGGPAFCCGVVQYAMGEGEKGVNIYNSSLSMKENFQAKRMITWCPSCTQQFINMEGESKAKQYSGEEIHTTEFLNNILENSPIELQPIEMSVGFHYHKSKGFIERESEYTIELLKKIPGLEVHVLEAPEELGTHCSTLQAVPELGEDGYNHLLKENFKRADELGLDAIVSGYHACHKGLSGARKNNDVPLINYLTLLAKSLGLTPKEDKIQLYYQKSFDNVKKELLPIAEKRGIKREKAERVLESIYGENDKLQLQINEAVGSDGASGEVKKS